MKMFREIHKYIKQQRENSYWQKRKKAEGVLQNSWYKDIMLLMAEEKDDIFLTDKVVGDFGCGPRGTLDWIETTKFKFGIDVLSLAYLDLDIDLSKTTYLTCSETKIPVANDFFDYLFTLNALDHTQNLELMCNEICRIIKPGGILIAGFNMNESFTLTEPQTLTESKLNKYLLNNFEILSEKRTNHKAGLKIAEVYQQTNAADLNKSYILWVKGVKNY